MISRHYGGVEPFIMSLVEGEASDACRSEANGGADLVQFPE